MAKTYEQLREQTEELNEVRILRAGAALFYAAKVKESGKKVERAVGAARHDFTRAKTEEDLSKKMDKMMDGLTSLGDALISQREMIGNLTGIAVAATLLAERTNKDLIKMMKGKKRR